MAKFVETVGRYRIYELEEKECKMFDKAYPTFATWFDEKDIGNMWLTENEASTIEDMKAWCEQN